MGEKGKLPKESAEKYGELSSLFSITKSVSEALNLEEALTLVLLQTARLMNAEVSSLRLMDKKKKKLVMQASYGLSEKHIERE